MKKLLLSLIAVSLAVCLCGCDTLEELSGFLETRPTEPEWNLNGVLAVMQDAVGGYSLSVHTRDGELFGPYDIDALPEFETARGYEAKEPLGLGRYKNWMTVVSKDGSACLTVYVGDSDLLCVAHDGQTEYYRDKAGVITRTLRHCFDRMEYDAAQKRVLPPYPGAAVALREFASVTYPALRKNLAPGSIYGFRDYDLIDYDVAESTESTLTGTIVYAALPDAVDSILLEQGETMDNEAYEGYVLVTETVHMELRDDGYWYRTDLIQ